MVGSLGEKIRKQGRRRGGFYTPSPKSARWARGTPGARGPPGTRGGQRTTTRARAPGGPEPRAPGVVRDHLHGDRAPGGPGPRAPGVVREDWGFSLTDPKAIPPAPDL